MILQRVLAVISAVLLVAAVAIATFSAQSVSLGQALFMVDHDVLDRLLAWSNRVWGNRAWEYVIQPVASPELISRQPVPETSAPRMNGWCMAHAGRPLCFAGGLTEVRGTPVLSDVASVSDHNQGLTRMAAEHPV